MNIEETNFLNAILSGIVAGLIVYIVTEITEKKRWGKAQKKLVRDFNITLNVLLSSVRNALSVKILSTTMDKQDFLSFISQQIMACFQEKHAPTIQTWTLKEWNVIISNFQQIQETLH